MKIVNICGATLSSRKSLAAIPRFPAVRSDDGAALFFKCPKCGRITSHGVFAPRFGEADGFYEESLCSCWPQGYFLRETRMDRKTPILELHSAITKAAHEYFETAGGDRDEARLQIIRDAVGENCRFCRLLGSYLADEVASL